MHVNNKIYIFLEQIVSKSKSKEEVTNTKRNLIHN